MFREGLEGFEGGLSAKNYVTIAQASTATTRDLRQLVALGALTKTGKLNASRYWLNISLQPGKSSQKTKFVSQLVMGFLALPKWHESTILQFQLGRRR
jgi:hypothetical protein